MPKAVQNWFRYSVSFEDNSIIYTQAVNASSALALAKRENPGRKVVCIIKFGNRPEMWVKHRLDDTHLHRINFAQIQYVAKCRSEEELKKLVSKLRRNFLDAYKLTK